MKIKRRGFTLIEILIVVVILAILAALVLPRLLSQPEKAYVAEAQQMLGVMARQQHVRAGEGGTWTAITASTADAPYAPIGMRSPGTQSWLYSSTATAVKARRNSGTYSSSYIVLNNALPAQWSAEAGGTNTYTCSNAAPSMGCTP